MTSAIPREFEASQAGDVLSGFGRALVQRPLESPLGEAARVFRGGIWGNFMRAEGPSGSNWPPRKDNKPHPLLIDTMLMLKAATDGGKPGAITEVGPRDTLLGVDASVVPYAEYHVTGTQKMPARNYHYAGDNTLDDMGETMATETIRELLP